MEFSDMIPLFVVVVFLIGTMGTYPTILAKVIMICNIVVFNVIRFVINPSSDIIALDIGYFIPGIIINIVLTKTWGLLGEILVGVVSFITGAIVGGSLLSMSFPDIYFKGNTVFLVISYIIIGALAATNNVILKRNGMYRFFQKKNRY